MNNGKICVSVCAETAEKTLEQVRRAADLADVIEIRFDCLKPAEIDNLWLGLAEFRKSFAGKLLATFRPKNKGQGGNRELSAEERNNFWNDCVFEFTDWADFEYDVEPQILGATPIVGFQSFIWSFHAFGAVPNEYNLNLVFSKLSDFLLLIFGRE